MNNPKKYKCAHCHLSLPLKELMAHIRLQHSTKNNLFACGQNNCMILCGNSSALSLHLTREHSDQEFNEDMQQENTNPAIQQPQYQIDIIDDEILQTEETAASNDSFDNVNFEIESDASEDQSLDFVAENLLNFNLFLHKTSFLPRKIVINKFCIFAIYF